MCVHVYASLCLFNWSNCFLHPWLSLLLAVDSPDYGEGKEDQLETAHSWTWAVSQPCCQQMFCGMWVTRNNLSLFFFLPLFNTVKTLKLTTRSPALLPPNYLLFKYSKLLVSFGISVASWTTVVLERCTWCVCCSAMVAHWPGLKTLMFLWDRLGVVW